MREVWHKVPTSIVFDVRGSTNAFWITLFLLAGRLAAGFSGASSSSSCNARFLPFAAVLRRGLLVFAAGFGASSSDVSGVADFTDGFVLKTGDLAVVGVADDDIEAAMRVPLRVERDMVEEKDRLRVRGPQQAAIFVVKEKDANKGHPSPDARRAQT